MKKEKIQTIIKARSNFTYFVENVFSKSESLFPKGFVSGEYIKEICELLQGNNKTARVGPRDHFKSTAFYAHFMWRLLQSSSSSTEGHYFSYQYQMAAYHINKIKQAIKSNEYFEGLIDKKKNAESVICYSWDNINFTTLEPHGLLEFKRGIHAPLLYVDDPFQDPASKMLITVIKKINSIFAGQILDMAQDELHVCGTPQTNNDFFFDKNVMSRFATHIKPAIVSEAKKEVLWPEWMGWEELQLRKKEKGEKLFKQEYLCSPTYAEDAFITKDVLYALVDPLLPDLPVNRPYETDNEVVAGFDIGKKAHPSHLAVFELVDGKRRMIHQKFFDHVDYIDQIEYLKLAIENFKIDNLFYDDTRGEFESFQEQSILPPEMTGIVFNTKSKNSMAVAFDAAISNKQIEFLDDRRMLEQLLLVTNDLKAVETPEGHGDSFWSVALTYKLEGEGQPEITIL